MVIASGKTSRIFARSNAGRVGAGKLRGMPPNAEPMVATGRPNR